jgi:hypothetical protein
MLPPRTLFLDLVENGKLSEEGLERVTGRAFKDGRQQLEAIKSEERFRQAPPRSPILRRLVRPKRAEQGVPCAGGDLFCSPRERGY